MNIKNKIKQLLLTDKNISSIAALERASGLSNGTINKWDKATPNMESAKKVAAILNVSVDYLLGTTDEKNPRQIDEDDMEEFYRIDLSRVPESERDTIKQALDKYTRFLLDDMGE